jgi:hypothetical protein
VHSTSSVSVRFREKKNSEGEFLFFREKRKTDEPIFFKNGTGNYCSITLSLGRRRERERDPPRVNSPPLEKAPREREEEEEEERIALVDTQKTTLKNTSGGEE